MGFRELSTNWNLSAFASLREENSIYSVSTIDDKTGSVVLKKNCKIGSHSTIMPGMTRWWLAFRQKVSRKDAKAQRNQGAKHEGKREDNRLNQQNG